MVWREPKNHGDDCYFCSCEVQEYNSRTKTKISYPHLKSAIRPVHHGSDGVISTSPNTLDIISSNSESANSQSDDIGYSPPETSDEPQPFTQNELNDLVRDLGLPKDSSELLGSRLRAKNLLCPGTSFYVYRNREKECCWVNNLVTQNFLVFV